MMADSQEEHRGLKKSPSVKMGSGYICKRCCLQEINEAQAIVTKLPGYFGATMQVLKAGLSAHCMSARSNPGPVGLTGGIKE